jgi:transcriptional regulator GlxA family with amidase domain
LSAVFKREYHLSPVAYRNAVRIRIGKDLILTTDLPIARIARQLGFKQLTHFSGLFRKTFGISAREVQCQSRANKP